MEEFRSVPIDQLYESPLNNRRHFDEQAMIDLTASVKQKGVLTPLLVRENPSNGRTYEILAGARRYRAATAAELTHVPAMVRDVDDAAALELVVIENLQREDLNALDEAEGYEQLLQQPGYDVAGIAAKVGKSEGYVHQRLKLLALIEPAKQALLTDEITAGHALLLARLQPKDQAEAFKEGCFSSRWNGRRDERVTVGVKSLASWIEQNVHLDLRTAPFATDDPTLVPKAGSCKTCPKRTGYSPQLFPEIAKKDTCTDRHCYHTKVQAGIARKEAELTAAGTPAVRLSTEWSHEGPKKGKPLPDNAWREVKQGTKHCSSTQTGIIVDGRGTLGKTLQVCTDTKCKVHRGYGGSASTSKPSAAEQARQRSRAEEIRRKAEVRRRSFLAVGDAAPRTLGPAELERLAISYVDEMHNDVRQKLCDVLGIEVPKEKTSWGGGSRNYAKALRTHARGLDAAGLARFLVLLPLAHDYAGDTYYEGSRGQMKAAATQYGVDLGAIEKAVSGEFKAKAKERAERQKKAAARAKKKATAPAGKTPAKGTTAPKKKAAPKKPKKQAAKKAKAATPRWGAAHPIKPGGDVDALVTYGRGRQEFKTALAAATAPMLARAIAAVEENHTPGSAAKLRVLRARLKALQPAASGDNVVDADFVEEGAGAEASPS